MKTLFRKTLTRPVLAVALAMAGLATSGAAIAAGTLSGTAITNLATLNYSVGGTPQTLIESKDGAGNSTPGTGGGASTSFVVDSKINLLVATTDTTFVSVVPGVTGFSGFQPNSATQVTTFTVTNLGNSTQDFALAAASLANGITFFGGTDNFDGTCVARVESGATPGYQSAVDTATFIDELAADGAKTVYVVCAVPIARVNNDFAVVSLTATARVGGTAGTEGVALVETTNANTAGVDIVFADGAGTDDAARNANFSARSAIKVVTATLTVTKTATPVCDPLNGNTFPKNIPGTFVRYSITIANTGASSATLTSIGDALTTLVTFDANLITGAGGTGTAATACSVASGTPTSAAGSGFSATKVGGTRAGFPKFFTSTSSVDGIDFVAPDVKVNFSLVLPVESGYTAGELKAGESVSVIYQVLIN